MPENGPNPSVGEVFNELGKSTKRLLQSEINLARAELRETASHLGKYSALAAVCGTLVALSVFPFLAFLVIGLGKLLGDNYWLSSLIVGITAALIGGLLAFYSYRQLKAWDVVLPLTQESIKHEREQVLKKVNEIKESAQLNRRAS